MASNDEKGRQLDGRYKQGVDKGAMSSLSIPLPMKPLSSKPQFPVDDIPKQLLRQDASKKQKHRKYT
jgi:hypothetical protein